MTDDVAELCLRNNSLQNLAITDREPAGRFRRGAGAG
jgi:NAD-specific glutamate dehydrogenase